jgi:pimeloyl-ACP methyl ester carboxylesterase
MNAPAWARAGLVLALALAACAAPVDVRPAGIVEVYTSLNAYALSRDTLSDDAIVTLARAGLDQKILEDPLGAIRELHAMALTGDRRERLYALAECCYAAGERTGDASLFLASAVYADLFLFGGGPEPPPGGFRRRFRRACDLYNVGLARAFSRNGEAGEEFVPVSRRVTLPVGTLDVQTGELPLRIAGQRYDTLRPAVTMQVMGFRARSVKSGLGAALVALRATGTDEEERRAHLAPRSTLAVTAFLFIDGDLESFGPAPVQARMEFHRPTEQREVTVAGREVPLEFDVTAPLAWQLAESRPWDKELSRFLDPDEAGVSSGVFLANPYEPGKIPIVFVHGTASSPARWAEVLNELNDDGLIASRCQFWVYRYASGAPILVSASGLRRGLARVVRDLDPEGKDDALRHMVVIGHSQGGLIARLMLTDGGDRFWDALSKTPIDQIELTDTERRNLRSVFCFEPCPTVTRAVFVATPHRGSYVAGNWLGTIGSWLVSVPKAVARGTERLAKLALGGAEIDVEKFSTAVDDMAPGSSFLTVLDASPMAPGVPVHSIVAVDGDGPVEEGDDGVVMYSAAHMPSARSEVVVNSPHSCQAHPAVVAEIRRILREHLAALPEPAPAPAAAPVPAK